MQRVHQEGYRQAIDLQRTALAVRSARGGRPRRVAQDPRQNQNGPALGKRPDHVVKPTCFYCRIHQFVASQRKHSLLDD